jgi:hypothetical protein
MNEKDPRGNAGRGIDGSDSTATLRPLVMIQREVRPGVALPVRAYEVE